MIGTIKAHYTMHNWNQEVVTVDYGMQHMIA